MLMLVPVARSCVRVRACARVCMRVRVWLWLWLWLYCSGDACWMVCMCGPRQRLRLHLLAHTRPMAVA